LNGATNERGSPSGGSRCGFLGLDELLLGVGGLGTVVGVAEDGAENSKGGSVVENRAEGDGRGLNGWEVWR
jgi:hypothetical protein